ncbi:hypothetical protein [Amycolatopsis circi]|uniref:hypothetical protein n=1 Tax=Amycolatopsis circi TaxID=871959 RepID=UPI000E23C665|nr:hypothetical protein [Amycolatopsis circi]
MPLYSRNVRRVSPRNLDLTGRTGIFAAQPVFEIPDSESPRFYEVNALSRVPGPTLAPASASLHPDVEFAEAERRFTAQDRLTSLFGRLIRPEEIANLITCVSSELSSATTGGALRGGDGVTSPIIS